MDRPCRLNRCHLLLGIALLGAGMPAALRAGLANAGKRGLYVRSIDEVLALPDKEVDLATAALIISEQWSDVVHGLRYRAQIDEMAEEIRRRLHERRLRPNFRAIAVINDYLFRELGFTAVATADDPNDLFLHSVLDRRRGYCLSLSTLYLALGERLGLPLYGVVVPGHFFVRYDSRTVRFNIECTAQGATLSDKHYRETRQVPTGRDRLYLENLTKKQTLGCLFNNFGVVYLGMGRPKLAEMALDLAARINPKLAEARSNLSIALQQQGQRADARAELEQARANNPHDPAVHRELGRLHLRAGRYDEALRSLQRSLELDPNSPDTHVLLGRLFQARGAYRRAREYLDEALRLDPHDAFAHLSRGQLFQSLENYQAAIKAYREALRWDPVAFAAEVPYRIGVCYRKLGWMDDAVRSFEEVLSRDPQSFAALISLGEIQAQQEAYAQAIPYYRRALALRPTDAATHYNLAVCYAQMDQPDLAEQAFAQALDANPGMGAAHYGLAVSYYNRGLYERAQEHVDRAQSLGFEVPQDLLERLAARRERSR